MSAFFSRDDILKALAAKNMKHRVLNYSPIFSQLVSAHGDAILQSFLDAADKMNVSQSWTLPIHLLNWLLQQEKWRPLIDDQLKKELLTASVIRWSLAGLEHVEAKGMMVKSRHLKTMAMGIWKSAEPHQSSKIVSVQFSDRDPIIEEGYAVSYEQGSWQHLKWMALPA